MIEENYNHACCQEVESRTLLGVDAISSQFDNQIDTSNWFDFLNSLDKYPLGKLLWKNYVPLKVVKSRLRCGQSNGLRILDCKTYGKKLVEFKYDCNQIGCYRCSKKRQKRLKNQFLPYFDSYIPTRDKRFRFISISPLNYNSIEDYKIAKKSLSNFLRSDYGKSLIDGGLIIVETTEDGKGWHIHFHLAIFSKYLNNRPFFNKEANNWEDSELVKQLKKFFKREVNVDIRQIKFDKISKINSVVLDYVLSYVSSFKDNFSSLEKYAEYLAFFRKKKIITTFGTFFKNPAPKIKKHCPLCGGNCKFIFDGQEIDKLLSQNVKPFFSESKPPPIEIVYIFPKKSDFSISETNLDLIRKVKEKLKGGLN